MNHQHDRHGIDARHAGNGRGKWALIGFLLVAAYFLWAEHRAHIVSWLPYALILLCPLMHLFMHRGHGGHGGHGHHGTNDAPRGRHDRTRDDAGDPT